MTETHESETEEATQPACTVCNYVLQPSVKGHIYSIYIYSHYMNDFNDAQTGGGESHMTDTRTPGHVTITYPRAWGRGWLRANGSRGAGLQGFEF